MREYLFRGKRVDNGEWVEGFLVSPCHIGDWVLCDPIDPETVGQYTGLTDMNGKRIFEGDIVGVDGKCYEVLAEEGCWIIVADGWDFLATNNDEIEVIGNIHDNPELRWEA